jgi:hypothetical protein
MIDQLVDQLAIDGMTVRALQTLDFVAPGQWQNVTGFDNLIRHVTGESDPALIAQIRARALVLYSDPEQGYQRAVSIYQLVDAADSKIGMAALAHKIGESISVLSFLSKLTPQEDKAQTLDLVMKAVAEGVAFCYTNGFPGDSVGEFMGAVGAYERENLIRMSAIVVYDGLIPLGPDYGLKLVQALQEISIEDIEGNAIYQRVKGLLPQGGAPGFVLQSIGAMQGYLGEFTAQRGITLDGVLGRLSSYIEFSESKLDYLAALLDISTNYMEHTGIQSVSRSLIERAVGEI